MAVVRELYNGILDAYDTIYPWVPSTFKNSISTFLSQLYIILETAFTNPSDLPSLTPSIISVMTLAFSIYWTISSAYHTARTGFRITLLLAKYGSIVALILGCLGWINPDEATLPQNGGLTVARSIISGWHTLVRYLEAPRSSSRRTSRKFSHSTSQPRKKKSKPARKPWDRFASSSRDESPPSSNTRFKFSRDKAASHSSSSSSSSSFSSRGDSQGDQASRYSSFAPLDALGLGRLGGVGGDALAVLVSSLGLDHRGDEHNDQRESFFGRKAKELWEKNKDAWQTIGKAGGIYGVDGSDEKVFGSSDGTETR